MLEQENPGSVTDYGCFMIEIPEPQKIHKIIMPPAPERLFGHNGYRFMTGNLFWYFIVTNRPVQDSVKSMFLQEDAELQSMGLIRYGS